MSKEPTIKIEQVSLNPSLPCSLELTDELAIKHLKEKGYKVSKELPQ